jgi:hypothetical protein
LGDEKTIKMENIKGKTQTLRFNHHAFPLFISMIFFLGWRHSFLTGVLSRNPQFDVWTPLHFFKKLTHFNDNPVQRHDFLFTFPPIHSPAIFINPIAPTLVLDGKRIPDTFCIPKS